MIRRKGLRRSALVALLAALTAVVPATAAHAGYAERQQEIRKQIEARKAAIKADQEKELALERQIAASDARRWALRGEVARLQARLAAARDELSRLETQIDILSADLEREQANLEATQAELEKQTGFFNDRVASIYMHAPTALDRTFQLAGNFEEFLVSAQYQAHAVQQDIDTVRKIEATKRAIIDKQNAIQAKQQLLLKSRQDTVKHAQEIASLRVARTATVNQIQSELDQRGRLLHDVRKEKEAYERSLRELEAESRAIEAFLRQQQGGGRVIRGIGGYMKWPVSGPITSGYGWRTHPVFHTRSFHTGIDIGCSQGTPIGAARAGRVIDAGSRGGYGNVVIIDHGHGIATVYAHLSAIWVSVGQSVRTLQNIGAAGMTGYATGPHLHWEVRSEGQHTNPMGWL